MAKIITKNDEIIFLIDKIARNPIFLNHENVSLNDIYSAFESGELRLQTNDEDGTSVIDDTDLKEINKVIPWLFKIIEKPRSFIRTYEEKVPIETAKRINYKAISMLSRDSNDWYDRTILNVKPKNIVSDVSEETIDIYENRFIVALIDKISVALSQARLHFVEQINQYNEEKRRQVMEGLFVFTRYSFPYLSKVQKTTAEDDDAFLQKLNNQLEEIKSAESRISIMKATVFYTELHKLKKIVSPIHRTNILMFDYAYHQAYMLWRYLENKNQDIILGKKMDATQAEIEGAYSLYAFLCLLVGTKDMKYECDGDTEFSFNGTSIELQKSIVLRKNDDYLKLDVKNGLIRIGYLVDEKQKKFETIGLSPSFLNFELMGRGEVEETTKKLLNESSLIRNNGQLRSVFSLVPINMERCSDITSYSMKTYRRFYSMGDNFSDAETEENSLRWGNYKAGIAIVNVTSLRTNLLKLERVINGLMNRNKILYGRKESFKCPICGHEIGNVANKDTFSCPKCNHAFSINHCSNCDPEHEHPIVWVKYENDDFLKSKEIVKGIDSMNPFNKLSQIESLMGEYASTAFDLIKDQGIWKMKTICPRCGVVLGDVKEKTITKKSKWHDTTKKRL